MMTNLCLILALWKRDFKHVRKMSSLTSLVNTHRLIRNDTFSFYGVFRLKEANYLRKYSLGGNCRSLLTCADCTGSSESELYAYALSPVFPEHGSFVDNL